MDEAPSVGPVAAARSVAERRHRIEAAIVVAALVALAVLLYGGYDLGWSWTGFGDNDHLWDYLQLLVLPVVLATLPLWLRTHRRAGRRWAIVIAAVLGVFGVLLVGGYALGWAWTGFEGKAVWDWLDLLILPVTLSLMPLWLETHERLESRWLLALSVVLVVFAVLVVGGYGLGWAWTGFEGNTVWDWIHLLLVPFAVPAALTWHQVAERRARGELPPVPKPLEIRDAAEAGAEAAPS